MGVRCKRGLKNFNKKRLGNKKKGHQKSRKTWVWACQDPGNKNFFHQHCTKIPPNKKSSNHPPPPNIKQVAKICWSSPPPPNAGHGFATLLLQYHLYYSTSCITVSAVLQYRLYSSTSCITVRLSFELSSRDGHTVVTCSIITPAEDFGFFNSARRQIVQHKIHNLIWYFFQFLWDQKKMLSSIHHFIQ